MAYDHKTDSNHGDIKKARAAIIDLEVVNRRHEAFMR